MQQVATDGWSQVSRVDIQDKSEEIRKIRESLEREVNTLVSQKILVKNQSVA